MSEEESLNEQFIRIEKISRFTIMSTVVLLSCTKSKLDYKAPAQELYSASPLFRGTLTYGKSLNPDKMYILSAKHYLVL